MLNDPYALYVHCDAAMDYTHNNPGGLGFYIKFPDFVNLDDVEKSIGRYEQKNIETLELTAINESMKELLKLSSKHELEFKKIRTIIFITDRFGLNDQNRTSPYRIRDWRKNGWNNYEGKEIKNWRLLDEVDKNRKKLSQKISCFVAINYVGRKYNRSADKLSKVAKKSAITKKDINHRAVKVGERLFDRGWVNYSAISSGDEILIHPYYKDFIKKHWDISADICDGKYVGHCVKIYVDSEKESQLHRKHKYLVKVEDVFTHHITIQDEIIEPTV